MTTETVNYKNIVINSSVLLTICAILEMTLHECGHFIAALLVGAKDVVLFHNYVSDTVDGLSASDILFVKAAGPNVSLLIGLVFHFLCFANSSRNLGFLFCLYMAVFGYIGCFGYVMVSALFVYGDTGFICYLLDFPFWLTVVVSIMGAVILFFLMKNLTRYFVELGTESIVENTENRVKFVNSLMVYPMLIGIVITTLLNLPAPSFLSILAPVCSPFTLMWTYGYVRSKKYPHAHYNSNIRAIDKIDFLWIVVLLLIVNLNRMLTSGFFF